MTALSRRRFLGITGALGGLSALGLAGCSTSPSASPSGSPGEVTGVSNVVLPGSAPERWNEVLSAVNTKMEDELGATLDAQFFPWSNFGQQSLLKFTTGEEFDTGLQAMWLNLAQLVADGALTDLTGRIEDYPNLAATVDPSLLEANAWDGTTWGIPQVNTIGRLHHHLIRQDLADKHGLEVESYEDFERYLYTIKEKESGMIPFYAASGTAWILAIPRPTATFDAASWEDPHTIPLSYGGKGFWFFPDKNAASTGSASLVPFWEMPQVVETFRRIRKYYEDGIINADAITVDNATVKSQFIAGLYASTWAVTDGLSSSVLPEMQKAVPGATLANVAPFRDGLSAAKPNATSQADNLVVVPTQGNVERALQIQDWLSIRENHDLLSFGVEGVDWEPLGEDRIRPLSAYSFPGFALCWRVALERKPEAMTTSEEKIFTWSQDPANFTVDPFASFKSDETEVSSEVAAMTQVMTEFGNPLYYGTVDVDQQLDKLRSAADDAGLDKLISTLEAQANAHLAKG